MLRRASFVVAGALSTLWLLGGQTAFAAEEQIEKQAREECRELLREGGFEDIDFDDMRSRDDGDTLVIEVEAEAKGGEESEQRCVYDVKDEKARLAD